MIKKLTSLTLLLLALNINGQNPIVEDIFTADPAALVYNDTVYLYTGHDEGTSYYNMNDWQLFTTADMVNWTSHGEILNVSAFSWSKGDAWAAEVEERDGKFYFYICTEHASISGKALGVAVADSPLGPFVDARGSALVTNDMTTEVNSTWDDIDPTVFVDDDGQAYIYWGNSGCYYAKLKDNMIELDGDIQFVSLPSFTEAPYIHKKDGVYYLSYAYGWEEEIAYATASSITGPWTFRGIINTHVNNCNTNHQSIIEFKNQWYFIYHTGDIGGSYQRSVAVDYLFYNEDGSIREIVQTRDGVESTEQTKECLPQPVNLSFSVNDGDFLFGDNTMLALGDKLSIQASLDSQEGTWSWTGPNGFSSSAREIAFENASVDLTGTYKVIHTSTCGTKSIALFDLSVSPIIVGDSYIIKPYNTDLIIGLENGSGSNGVNVLVSEDMNVDHQRFLFTSAENEYYRITPVNAPLEALDIYNISSDDGANVVTWEYWGGHGQQFKLLPAGNNTYNLIARHSGKCLDWKVTENNLIQWTCHGGDNQKFELIDMDATFIPEPVSENQIRVFPVPATNQNLHIDISSLSDATAMKIIDMNGVILFEDCNLHGEIIHPELGNVARGLYIIQVLTKDKTYFQKTIL